MKKILKCTALVALVLGMGLTACDSKSKSGGGKKADYPLYSSKDHANKIGAQLKVEVLGFSDKVMDVTKGEFAGNTTLKELHFGKMVNIAEEAFKGCTSLERIHMSQTVDVINDYAFEGCIALKSLDGDIRTIGLGAFKGCTALDSVRTRDNIYWVREGAFEGCTNLKSVLMGMTLSKYEDGAFKDCPNIEEISVPSAWRRHMFNEYKDMKNLKKVYLLVMEHYAFPADSKAFPAGQVDLYVPDALLEQYKNDASWARFKSILPLSQSAYYKADGWSK